MCATDTSGNVVPLLRPAAASADAPRPNIRAFDLVDDARASIGLCLLASEGLPGPHAREFGAVLEVVRGMLGRALTVMSPLAQERAQ